MKSPAYSTLFNEVFDSGHVAKVPEILVSICYATHPHRLVVNRPILVLQEEAVRGGIVHCLLLNAQPLKRKLCVAIDKNLRGWIDLLDQFGLLNKKLVTHTAALPICLEVH